MGLLSRAFKHLGAGGLAAGGALGASVATEGDDPLAAALLGATLVGSKAKALQGLVRSGIGRGLRGKANSLYGHGLTDLQIADALELIRADAKKWGTTNLSRDLMFDIMNLRNPL